MALRDPGNTVPVGDVTGQQAHAAGCQVGVPGRITHDSGDLMATPVRLADGRSSGSVTRAPYVEPVRRVEYELSPLGRSLLPPMAVTCAWAQERWEELLDAREASSPLDRAR
jgi:hypothetical protein